MERTLELNYDKLVIGADLSALSFCYINKIPFVYLRHLKPYQYGLEEDYEQKLKIYDHLFFVLSISGLCQIGDKVQSYRLEEDNFLKVTTKNNCLIKISYKNLIISDDYKLEGLPPPIGKTNYDNCVIDEMGYTDTFKMPSIKETGLRCPKTFFPTRKYVKGSRSYLNLYVNSSITDEELTMQEYSESYIRLRVYRILNKMQTLLHYKRTVYPLGKNLYNLPDNIKILTESHEEIFKQDKNFHGDLEFIESQVWKKYLKKQEEPCILPG